MESNLKGCPFCNSKAEVLDLRKYKVFMVKCRKCGAVVEGASKRRAIDRWERRENEAMVQELWKVVDEFKVSVYGDKHDNVRRIKGELKGILRKYA